MTSDRTEGDAPDVVLREDGAWRRVLDASPGSGTLRLGGPVPGEAVVEVDGEGRWRCSGRVDHGAEGVLDLFLPLRRRERWVVGQMGQSLDGRIATESGHSHYVTGPEDIRRLHRLRALSDAVVVGAGTVASDDPRLTVREVEGTDPVRVVLDPRGRIDPDRRLFRQDPHRTCVVRITGGEAPPPPQGVGVLELPSAPDGIHPPDLVAGLAARGLRRILVEGGGLTVSRFLQADALDWLHVTVAPLLVGSGRPSLVLPPVETLQEALRPPCRTLRLGNDVLFELDLRGSGAEARGREEDAAQDPGPG